MLRRILPLALFLLALLPHRLQAVTCIAVPAACWPGLDCYQPQAVAWIQAFGADTCQPYPATSQWCWDDQCFFYFDYDDVLVGGVVGWCEFTLSCASGVDPGIEQSYQPDPYSWLYQQGPCDTGYSGPFCSSLYFDEPWPGCEVCEEAAFQPQLTAARRPDGRLRLSWTRHPNPSLFRVDEAPTPAGPWSLLVVTPDTTSTAGPMVGRSFFRVTQIFE